MIARRVKTDEGFKFFIPPASLSRAVALGYASIVLLIVLAAPVLANKGYWNPVFFLLLLGIAPLVIFFLILAFPPLSWLARLEVDRDRIRYIPVPPLRWIGESATMLSLTKKTREVLICQGSRDTYGGVFTTDKREFPYGFRLILRDSEGQDNELKIKTGNRLNPHQAQVLTTGIAATTGLLVRLVKREVRNDEAPQEAAWIPNSRSANLAAFSKLAFAFTPLLGGIVAGLSRASGARAALVGIVLWLAQTAIVVILGQPSPRRSKLTFAYWLTTAVTFAASYTVVYLITINSLRVR